MITPEDEAQIKRLTETYSVAEILMEIANHLDLRSREILESDNSTSGEKTQAYLDKDRMTRLKHLVAARI